MQTLHSPGINSTRLHSTNDAGTPHTPKITRFNKNPYTQKHCKQNTFLSTPFFLLLLHSHLLRVPDQNGVSLLYIMLEIHHSQGLTLASDIGHLTDKICKCPIDVSYKQTNVLLICYKGGHCPIISSFTRTSRPAFFFLRAAEATSAIDRLKDIKFIRTQVYVTKHNETARYIHTICTLTNHFNERVAHKFIINKQFPVLPYSSRTQRANTIAECFPFAGVASFSGQSTDGAGISRYVICFLIFVCLFVCLFVVCFDLCCFVLVMVIIY